MTRTWLGSRDALCRLEYSSCRKFSGTFVCRACNAATQVAQTRCKVSLAERLRGRLLNGMLENNKPMLKLKPKTMGNCRCKVWRPGPCPSMSFAFWGWLFRNLMSTSALLASQFRECSGARAPTPPDFQCLHWRKCSGSLQQLHHVWWTCSWNISWAWARISWNEDGSPNTGLQEEFKGKPD